MRPFKRSLAMIAVVLMSVLPGIHVQADASADESEWKEVDRSRGLRVLRKEIPGDPVFAYRGVGVLDAPLGKLISVARDVKRQPEWVNRLEETRILKELGPCHRVVYMKVDTPWPVSDRDFVIESKTIADPQTRTATIEVRSVEDPSMPPQDCCVRGVVHKNIIRLKSSEDNLKTEVDAEAHVDPKGSLPKWLVNAVQKSFPRKSLNGLLRQVGKPDIDDYFSNGGQQCPVR